MMKKRNTGIARVLSWAGRENIIARKENAKCRLRRIAIFFSQLIKKFIRFLPLRRFL